MSLKEIKHYLSLVFVKSVFNLRSETSKNYLSYAWWLIEPLMHMSAYYLVFGVFLDKGGKEYVIYLLTGLIPWLWISRTISHSSQSMLWGRQLMNQMYIPTIFFPMVCVVQNFFKQLIVLFLLVFLVYYLDTLVISWSLLWLIPVILVQLSFIFSIAIIAALLVPFFRDLSIVIPTLMQFTMFASGVFFDTNEVPENLQNLFYLNPVASILSFYRDILMYSSGVNIFQLVWVIFITICFMLI
ncbi:MAG: ABC transporter permease, partial [Cellvibrionales bacterium]|nr:ABC transporter permease [Cellvibrionales bacterium]